MAITYYVHEDIRQAQTLAGCFYSDVEAYEQLLVRAFGQWQWVGSEDWLPSPRYAYPLTLLEGSLEVPLVLVRDEAEAVRCLSNVCTHRGKIIVEQAGLQTAMLRCGYHGRCFRLDGRFRSMPAFKEALDFPTDKDDLPSLPLGTWGTFLFTALRPPQQPLEDFLAPLRRRMAFYPFDRLRYQPAHSRSYEIKAHWALYCENYLEGFHVPFVHPSLGERLDYQAYQTECFAGCSLQLGVADEQAEAFDLPPDALDYGKRIHAYYWWLFPNMMINVYTWGVSVNVVEPLGLARTRVRFYTYWLDDTRAAEAYAQAAIHDTEMEDEAVVESVQKGLRSPLYDRGRFSPEREQGVHHFQRLLVECLASTR